MKRNYYKGLFLTAALYDFSLGFNFLFFYKAIFRLLQIPFPPNPAYLSLSAAFIMVIGIGYFFAYRNIDTNRDLVILGAIYKFVYVAVGFYYFLLHMIPHMVFIGIAVIDILFLALFIEFLYSTKRQKN